MAKTKKTIPARKKNCMNIKAVCELYNISYKTWRAWIEDHQDRLCIKGGCFTPAQLKIIDRLFS